MKDYFFLRSVFLYTLVLFCATIGSAQSSPSPAFAPAKIAIVHSEMFADQKLGISRFLAVQSKLNEEFRQTLTELQKLKGQMDSAEKEFRSLPRELTDQKMIGDKTDAFERLKREFNFRSGEADTAMGKRYQELMKPVSDEVSKMLASFAKQKGIDIVIDASKTGGVYVFNNAPDITSQFVAYVNSQTAAKP